MNINRNAKPFVKWVGGKTQILNDLEAKIPKLITQSGIIDRYIEPFVGGGALFFHLKNKYKINKSYLIDNNEDLILTYSVIKTYTSDLISKLKKIESKYIKADTNKRAEYYYEIRNRYNKQKKEINYTHPDALWIKRASYLIFLNKTCFNGLFRQNSKGEFNVPHGLYKNPKICDLTNLESVSQALRNTNIICGDFSECKKYATSNALIYFDPPYRPLNTTSSFTSYTKNGFCDNEQVRLANLCNFLSKKGVYILLSNSDPKNENPNDDFFDELYSNYHIDRILASRMVNCNGNKRGQIKELLIANY